MNPFGGYALTLRERGLAVVPCGGDDGKKPLIKGWHKSKRSAATIAKLALRYPEANIGVVCGLSGVVIVDIDEPRLLAAMLARFGLTPLITRTPSGGYHLWYAAPVLLGPTDLRSEGLAVDIKAGRGTVIVPPSFNPQTGKPYEFERGSWDDLNRLPLFRVEAISGRALDESKTSPESAHSATTSALGGSATPSASGVVSKGARDNTLFYEAMLIASQVANEGELIAALERLNEIITGRRYPRPR